LLLKQKLVGGFSTHPEYCWQFMKTDTLGLDVANLEYISGTQEQRFYVTPPSIGAFYIETRSYSSTRIVDTYMSLYLAGADTKVGFDDDSGGNLNARISHSFSDTYDYYVLLRGYSSSTSGYCYLMFRPANEVFFAGTQDYDDQGVDRSTPLNDCKPFLQNMGYFVNVHCNLGFQEILEEASSGRKKIAGDYFVFAGHGFSNASGVVFYNGINSDGITYDELPAFANSKVVIWESCYGARNYSYNGNLVSMAYQSVVNGAMYSLGYAGEIYSNTGNVFPAKFFEALQTRSVEDAVTTATQWTIDSNWWYWTFFGQFNDDIANPILYKKGDSLKLSCGSGIYEANRKILGEKLSSNVSAKKRASAFDLKQGMFTKSGYVTNSKNVIDVPSELVIKSDSFAQNLVKNSGDEIYKFVAKTKSGDVPLAFIANTESNTVKYFQLDTQEQITASEFESLMGNPLEQ
jgi:hypothetical protein